QILSYYKLGKLIVQYEVSFDFNEPILSGPNWTYEYFPNGLIKEEVCKTIKRDNTEVIYYKINYSYEYWSSEK
ncbi:hypothetical protein, partial [Rhizobium leguminosarum]|uniref:hypothetical protein n=1 Tax=Rhizobium leguminosarum TaxID=384 RepID=UPI003F9CDEF1